MRLCNHKQCLVLTQKILDWRDLEKTKGAGLILRQTTVQSEGFCKIYYSHFIFEIIIVLRKIQNHSKKLSNYGSLSKIGGKNHYLEILKSKIGRKNHYLEILKSKIGRKNHYLEFLKSKIGRKNHYLDVLTQRWEGKTTTLKFCHKVVGFSSRFSH